MGPAVSEIYINENFLRKSIRARRVLNAKLLCKTTRDRALETQNFDLITPNFDIVSKSFI